MVNTGTPLSEADAPTDADDHQERCWGAVFGGRERLGTTQCHPLEGECHREHGCDSQPLVVSLPRCSLQKLPGVFKLNSSCYFWSISIALGWYSHWMIDAYNNQRWLIDIAWLLVVHVAMFDHGKTLRFTRMIKMPTLGVRWPGQLFFDANYLVNQSWVAIVGHPVRIFCVQSIT